MPITGLPPSAVDPVAQVVAALEAATAALAAGGGGSGNIDGGTPSSTFGTGIDGGTP